MAKISQNSIDELKAKNKKLKEALRKLLDNKLLKEIVETNIKLEKVIEFMKNDRERLEKDYVEERRKVREQETINYSLEAENKKLKIVKTMYNKILEITQEIHKNWINTEIWMCSYSGDPHEAVLNHDEIGRAIYGSNITLVKDYIYENYDKDISIKDLSHFEIS